MGLIMYFPFVKRLTEQFDGDIFLLSLPHVSQRMTDIVPTARETAFLVKDMLV